MKNKKIYKNVKAIYAFYINDKYYIGSTTELYGRINTHLSTLKANKHHSVYLQRTYNKYPGKVKYKILKVFNKDTERKDILISEKHYIKKYNSVFNSEKDPTSKSNDEATKLKISKTLKKLYKSGKLVNPWVNRGDKLKVYDFKGVHIFTGYSNEIVEKFNISNRSVVNQCVLKKRYYATKFKIIIMKEQNSFFEIIKYLIDKNKLPIYRVEDTKQLLSQNSDIIKKILDNEFIYKSNKNNKSYSFFGLFGNAVMRSDFHDYYCGIKQGTLTVERRRQLELKGYL
jgi:hypothetical protein